MDAADGDAECYSAGLFYGNLLAKSLSEITCAGWTANAPGAPEPFDKSASSMRLIETSIIIIIIIIIIILIKVVVIRNDDLTINFCIIKLK